MDIFKKHLEKNFNKASSSYEEVAFIQQKSAQKLVHMLATCLPDFYPEAVLDVGAGSGYVTEMLIERFPQSSYSLNDIARDMLTLAEEKLSPRKKITLIVGDMESCEFGFYPLIISNMALQWVSDLPKMVRKLYNHSSVIAFTSLLHSSFQEWTEMVRRLSIPPPTYRYPLQKEREASLLSLQATKYFFYVQEFKVEFPHAYAFMRYLQKLGAHKASNNISVRGMKKILAAYVHKFSITYQVCGAILFNKENASLYNRN